MVMNKILLIVGMFLISISLVSASIGVGISPSKVSDQVVSKQEKNCTFTIYNTGDIPVLIKMSASDELEGKVKFYPEELSIIPEPEPHRLPPVNGKDVIVTVKAPVSRDLKKITGHIVATAGAAPGSSFGGSGAVASRFELQISPPKHFWDYMTDKQIILVNLLILLVIIIFIVRWLMKKKGIHFALVKEEE